MGCQNHLIIPLAIFCAEFVEVGEVGVGCWGVVVVVDSEVGRG